MSAERGRTLQHKDCDEAHWFIATPVFATSVQIVMAAPESATQRRGWVCGHAELRRCQLPVLARLGEATPVLAMSVRMGVTAPEPAAQITGT